MTKEKILNVRVTPQQYEKIQSLAASYSMTVSKYARYVMTSDNLDCDLLSKQKVLEILSDMSNDINRTCEFLEKDYPDICDSLEERMSKLCRTLNS